MTKVLGQAIVLQCPELALCRIMKAARIRMETGAAGNARMRAQHINKYLRGTQVTVTLL